MGSSEIAFGGDGGTGGGVGVKICSVRGKKLAGLNPFDAPDTLGILHNTMQKGREIVTQTCPIIRRVIDSGSTRI